MYVSWFCTPDRPPSSTDIWIILRWIIIYFSAARAARKPLPTGARSLNRMCALGSNSAVSTVGVAAAVAGGGRGERRQREGGSSRRGIVRRRRQRAGVTARVAFWRQQRFVRARVAATRKEEEQKRRQHRRGGGRYCRTAGDSKLRSGSLSFYACNALLLPASRTWQHLHYCWRASRSVAA